MHTSYSKVFFLILYRYKKKVSKGRIHKIQTLNLGGFPNLDVIDKGSENIHCSERFKREAVNGILNTWLKTGLSVFSASNRSPGVTLLP